MSSLILQASGQTVNDGGEAELKIVVSHDARSFTQKAFEVQGGAPSFAVRVYERFSDEAAPSTHSRTAWRYTLFSLRDAASDRDDFWYEFGVMRDDYTPKPAFDVYRRLVQELGGR